MLETKIKCSTCKEPKTINNFWSNKSRKNGIASECKQCGNKKRASAYANDLNVRIKKKQKTIISKYGKEALKLNKPELCPICLRSEPEVTDSLNRAFVIDHCHATNKIREIICTSCNKGLGYFKDNIESLQNAINYLNKHKGA
jgi:hypothetical protein